MCDRTLSQQRKLLGGIDGVYVNMNLGGYELFW